MRSYPPNPADPSQSSIEPQPVTHTAGLLRTLRDWAMRDHSRDQRPRTDCVGKRFGRVVIQRGVGHEAETGRLIVLFHCDCGKAGIKRYDDFARTTRSCGCLQASRGKGFKIKHQIKNALTAMQDKRASAAEQNRGVHSDGVDQYGIKAIDDFESAEPFTELYVALDASQDELNKRDANQQYLQRSEARRLIESDGITSWHNYDSD